MEHESFYIVSSKDKPLSETRDKEYMHANNLLHRGVHILVEVFKGRFLLQKKAMHTENGGKWSSAVSGHVRSTETYKKAAIREAKEELGIDIEDSELHLLGKAGPCEDTNNEFVMIYTYLLDPDTEILTLSDEVDEVITCSLDDVVEDVEKNPERYSPAFLHAFNVFIWAEKGMRVNSEKGDT
jgi:isopentenyldiphosphate isomerase